MKIEERPFVLDATISYCVSLVDFFLEEKNVILQQSIMPVENNYLIGDEHHFEQMLVTLLEYCIGHCPSEETIQLSVEENLLDENRSMFVFKIQHPFIRKKHSLLYSISSFFTSNKSRLPNLKNISLSIVKSYIDLMHGSFSTEIYGSNRIITVSLPLSFAQSKVSAKKKSTTISGSTILLAEDNDLNVNIIQEILTSQGATVEIATNGKKAFDMFSSSIPFYYDLILMDVMMPFMDGLEATRLIRTSFREDSKNVPIVAISVKTYSDDITKALDAGMNAYFTKPINRAVMLKTIADTLASSADAPQNTEKKDEKKECILLVDDDYSSFSTVTSLISSCGFSVETAINGSVCLNKIKQSQPGDYKMILMSLHMPVMDGFDATSAIRSLPNTELAKIPIIAMSKESNSSDREKAIQVGINNYIFKPLTRERFLSVLRVLN